MLILDGCVVSWHFWRTDTRGVVSVHVRDEAHPEQLLRQHMQLDVEPEPWGAFTTFQHRGMFAGSKDQKLADGGHLNPSRASGWLQTGEAWHMQDLALPHRLNIPSLTMHS